jgi:apolipoprotein N-acyltransferase
MAAINALFAESVLTGFRIPGTRGDRVESSLPGEPVAAIRGVASIGVRPRFLRNNLLAGWSVALLMVVGFLVYGFVKISRPIPVKGHLKVVLVQQNIDSWLAGPSTERQMLLTGEKLSEKGIKAIGGKPDLIVWSEESLLRPYRYSKGFYDKEPPSDPFVGFLKRINTPVLLGAPYVLSYAKQEVLNASILLTPNGDLADYYGKRRLVPFAEYVPFWNVPFVRRFMEDVIGIGGGWTPGDRNTIYTVPLRSGGSVRFGTPICFEDSFSSIARDFFLGGADLLINLTNTSWSNTVSAETQQLVAARFLSIETKRVMIRSTNSGVTSIIDPWGRVIASLPPFKPAYLAADVPVYDNSRFTAYTLYGDYLPFLLAALLVLVLLSLSGYLPMRLRLSNRS